MVNKPVYDGKEVYRYMEKPKFYITTAIAYTSRKPHIGNTYDIVLADLIARYKRMQGFDVLFQTGSDEHGQKIEEYAEKAGITPKAYVDGVSAQIKSVWDCMNVTYDRFIRTTDADHERVVQKIFKKLYEQGDIYKGAYEGKYCVPCESFFTPSQLRDGKCPDCGREVVDAKEEAYFLKLGKYQDRLLQYYEEHPDFIAPVSRRNEMINNFLKPGLSDLCVSRSSFNGACPCRLTISMSSMSGSTRFRTISPAAAMTPTARRRNIRNIGPPTCMSSARTSCGSTPSIGPSS